MPRKKNDITIIIVGLVAIGFVASIIGTPFLVDYLKYDSYYKKDFIDPTTYQAVFLTNDQIYFGRLKNASTDYLILADVYYVKVNEGGAGQLVKLGVGEPHGPKNEMIINQNQILFWENLTSDSPVVKAIQGKK